MWALEFPSRLSAAHRIRGSPAGGRFLQAGMAGKIALGGMLVIVGLAVATRLYKSLEAWLVQISPDWQTRLTPSL